MISPTRHCWFLPLNKHGAKVKQTMIHEQESYYSQCMVKQDVRSGNIILSGLFAHDPGTESEGCVFPGLRIPHSTA